MEIMLPLYKVKVDGEKYRVIAPEHSIQDILRYALDQAGDPDHFLMLAWYVSNHG